MNEATQITHPVWCDPAECTFGERGLHQSAPLVLGLKPNDVKTMVRITQYAGVDGYPASKAPGIELTIKIPVFDPEDIEAGLDEDYVIAFLPERVLALGHQLVAAGQAALR